MILSLDKTLSILFKLHFRLERKKTHFKLRLDFSKCVSGSEEIRGNTSKNDD